MNTLLHIADVSSPADIADRIGELRAEAKRINNEAAELEAALIAAHETAVDGRQFRVAISYNVERKLVDWKAVAAKLNPSRQLVRAHTKTSVSNRVRVTALKKG